MAAAVPRRNDDQVKVTGAQLGGDRDGPGAGVGPGGCPGVVETRENMDGGVGPEEHRAGGGPRVNDHGVTERDHVSQSPQRALRQDVKVPELDGPPGLVPPETERFGGLLFPTVEVYNFVILSDAISDGQPIPAQHTADGIDTSPPLMFKGVPRDPDNPTVGLALTVVDPDAFDWVHWLIYDIPAVVPVELHEGIALGVGTLPDGTKQGMNDFGSIGYRGPDPPPGTNRYVFTLYALSGPTGLAPGTDIATLLAALEPLTLVQTQITTTYTRP